MTVIFPQDLISCVVLVFTKLGAYIPMNWALSVLASSLMTFLIPNGTSECLPSEALDQLSITRFYTLTTGSSDGLTRTIAVPSRLYHKESPEKPFAGARTALKDIFRLEGVKTTMMSRSYTELFGPDTGSAEYVRKLLSLGAVIVGKTKMTQFASSDEPTDQWIDFHCPVNPRGDQYQSPSGSSSGAAAALAGYPWLDQSVGGDCESCRSEVFHVLATQYLTKPAAGSIRAPATCNGLFSLRPSFGSTSMAGIVINSP